MRTNLRLFDFGAVAVLELGAAGAMPGFSGAGFSSSGRSDRSAK
jgi:hypothetical protein